MSAAIVALSLIATAASAETLDLRIATASDVGAELLTRSGSATHGEFGQVSDVGERVVGMRWIGVTIPARARIVSAWVELSAPELARAPSDLTLRAQAADAAGPFLSTVGDISRRPRTSSSVRFGPVATGPGQLTTRQRTADLSALVQEVVNRPGWVSGNPLALIITGVDSMTASLLNEDRTTSTSVLHVEYSPDPPPPVESPVAALSLSQPSTPPLTVLADASSSTDDVATPIANYHFDFGDGSPPVTTTAPTAVATHAYASVGPWTVTLIVTDTGGNPSAPVTANITLQPELAPVAQLAVAQLASPPLTVSANGVGSTDPDLTPIASYRFDFGDGSPPVTVNAPAFSAQHTYADAGSHTVTLIVTDTGGNASAPASFTISVAPPDQPPVANLTLSQPPTPPLTVRADGSASTDGDITPIASYRFDFGDGSPPITTTAPTAIATHAYASVGPWTVTLIATDTGGNPSAPVTANITLEPEVAPTAQLAVSQLASPPLTVSANGVGSTDPDLTPIASYRFDFGDGSPPVTVNTPAFTAQHTYADAGSHTVTLIVTDTGGNTSAPASFTISVAPPDQPPVANLTLSQPPTPPLTVRADGSASTDGDITPIASYRFDFGDGSPPITTTAPTAIATHAYASVGPWTVTLIATDTGGQPSAPVTANITLEPEVAPTAQLAVSQLSSPPLTVSANGAGSTDPDLTPIASYRFNFGDGSPPVTVNAPAFSAQHTYAAGGNHTVTLVATDTGGLESAPVSMLVNVIAAVPGSWEGRITTSSNDAEESATGVMNLVSSDLELVHDNTDQVVGMRWTGLTIPSGATITAAWIQFSAKESQSEVTNVTFRAQAADAPPTFTTSAGNISSRPRTTASAAWAPVPWTAGQTTPAQRTPNLSAVIQAVVSRPGWASGNPLVIIVTGTGHRTPWSWDGVHASAPLLHVDYTTGSSPPDQPPIASLTVAQVASPDFTVFADGSASTDTDFTPIASYRFDFGDGSPPVTVYAPGTSTQHTYAGAGTYTVRLVATDTGLLTSAPAVQNITVSSLTPPPVRVSVGYYDTHHLENPQPKPDPWMGSAGVVFVGIPDTPTGGWDSSTLKIDNLSGATMTNVVITADIGTNHYALWGTNNIPAGQSLILAQTGFENFDGSDTSPAGCFSCDPSLCLTQVRSTVPVIHVTFEGTTTDYFDTGQILNTHGVDGAGCPYTGGRNDESHNWVQVFTAGAAGQISGPDAAGAFHLPTTRTLWLSPPAPNPARGGVVMRFSLPVRGPVTLGVYDVAGRLVRTYLDRELEAGDYIKALDLNGVQAGVYFCDLRTRAGGVHRSLVVAR